MSDSPTPLPAFATAAGVVAGATARLLVDPQGEVAPPDAVAFTGPARLVAVPAGTGTVFSTADLPIDVGAGRRHRPVANVAVIDLGGVVAEIVRLAATGDGLVVVAREVDGRGRPVRSTPAVVFAGDLVSRSESPPSDDAGRADTLDLLLGMLGVTDAVVTSDGVVLHRGDVEADRSDIQQRLHPAPTLAEQAHRALPLI